jgi:1-deoxy-D-xylulose-5-phosphate synthase
MGSVAPIVRGRADVLRRHCGVAVLAYGAATDIALGAYEAIAATGTSPLPTIVNARFAKPLDEALLLELADDHAYLITLEEHALAGGFGSAVLEFASDRGLGLRVERIGVPDLLVQHDSTDKQRARFGLSVDAVAARILALSSDARTPVGRP